MVVTRKKCSFNKNNTAWVHEINMNAFVTFKVI